MESQPASTAQVASSGTTSAEKAEYLRRFGKMKFIRKVKLGEWDDALLDLYRDNEDLQTETISSTKGSALHFAISDNRRDIAKKLLEILADHPKKIKEMKNDRGDNPLHLAARLGQADVCKDMVDMDPELIRSENIDGETPLFLAALLDGNEETFYTLHRKYSADKSVTRDDNYYRVCERNTDGNNILHVTIFRENFQFALSITDLYPGLITFKNHIGQSPFHILATNPSAFKSGCHLGLIDGFIYRCLPDEVKMERSYAESTDQQNRNSKDTRIDVLENCETCCSSVVEIFLKGVVAVFSLATWKTCWRKILNIETPLPEQNKRMSNDVITKLKDLKRKHSYSLELMRVLVMFYDQGNVWTHVETAGSKPTDDSAGSNHQSDAKDMEAALANDLTMIASSVSDSEVISRGMQKMGTNETMPKMLENMYELITLLKSQEKNMNELITLLKSKAKDGNAGLEKDDGSLSSSMVVTKSSGMKKSCSIFLISARMGVTEIVEEILNYFPKAIYDEDEEGKNVLLFAAEYKQPAVYKMLLEKLKPEPEKVTHLFEKVDKNGNSALHLAARIDYCQSWHTSGVALQMQCELKWYQFIKDDLRLRRRCGLNYEGKTPKEIFMNTHKEMKQEAQIWLTHTSTTCLTVSTIIAAVAFASIADLQGGKKNLDMPLHHVFTFSFLVSVCSLLASVGMFLSILASHFEMMDFLYKLPFKLIVGVTLLFLSHFAMVVSFSISHLNVMEDRFKMTTLSIVATVFVPIALFAWSIIPLYFRLIRSTLTQPKRRNQITTLN